MKGKHSNSNFAPVIPMSQEKCEWFQLVYPFTCMVAGMTGSGKTVRVQSLLEHAQTVIDQPLFTGAKRLQEIIYDHANNRICQGDPGISGK